MNRSSWPPALVGVPLLVLGLLVAAAACSGDRDDRGKPATPKLFDPDPAHPWNRLHAAFYVRPWPGGGTYTHAGPDAPFGREGPFLVDGPTHRAALAALDTFLKQKHDERITDPLARAVMYRDLWYVFDKLAEPPV
jgi:hypothetical protein